MNNYDDLKRDAGSYEDERPENNDLAYNVVKLPDVLVERGQVERLAELYCRLCSLLEAVSLRKNSDAIALHNKALANLDRQAKLDIIKRVR